MLTPRQMLCLLEMASRLEQVQSFVVDVEGQINPHITSDQDFYELSKWLVQLGTDIDGHVDPNTLHVPDPHSELQPASFGLQFSNDQYADASALLYPHISPNSPPMPEDSKMGGIDPVLFGDVYPASGGSVSIYPE